MLGRAGLSFVRALGDFRSAKQPASHNRLTGTTVAACDNDKEIQRERNPTVSASALAYVVRSTELAAHTPRILNAPGLRLVRDNETIVEGARRCANKFSGVLLSIYLLRSL